MLVLAAVLGSLLTTGAFYLKKDKDNSVTVEYLYPRPLFWEQVTQLIENGEVVPLGFYGSRKKCYPCGSAI
jgi:hypothetical protein